MKLNLYTPNVVYLRIHTWVGSSVCCAKHWYGKLACGPHGSKEIEVEYILAQADADHLNTDDPCETAPYKAGETSHRFFSKEALLAAVVGCWQKHFPKARFLIEGHPNTLEPQWVITGPEDVRDRINALFAKCEDLGWWDGKHEPEIARLCNEWEDLWKKRVQTKERKVQASTKRTKRTKRCA